MNVLAPLSTPGERSDDWAALGFPLRVSDCAGLDGCSDESQEADECLTAPVPQQHGAAATRRQSPVE